MSSTPEPPATLVPAATSPVPLVDLVLDGLASEHSRRAYRRALGEFFSWYPSNASGEGFTRATVQRYRSHLAERSLSAASINLALAALRKLASEAASNELLAPEAAAAILSVGGARRTGVRTGNWLTLPQAQQLLEDPRPVDPERSARPRPAGAARGLWPLTSTTGTSGSDSRSRRLLPLAASPPRTGTGP